MQEIQVQSLDWEDPLEKAMATYSNILAWRIPMDGGTWQAADHGVTKSQTLLSDKAEHSDFTPFFKTLQLPLPSRVPRTLRCCTAQFHPCIKTSSFALLSSWNAFPPDPVWLTPSHIFLVLFAYCLFREGLWLHFWKLQTLLRPSFVYPVYLLYFSL